MVGWQLNDDLERFIRCLIMLLRRNFAGVNENNRDKANLASRLSVTAVGSDAE